MDHFCKTYNCSSGEKLKRQDSLDDFNIDDYTASDNVQATKSGNLV